jgi:UDP-N-acetylmuramate dehydrogenase
MKNPGFTKTDRPGFISANNPLLDYSTLGIGGPADFLAFIKSEEALLEACEFARSEKLKVYTIGAGSNILFADKGFRGLILRMDLARINLEDANFCWAEAGALVNTLVYLGGRLGFSGFENFAGLPGTVGGAICGNAGCYGAELGDKVELLRIFDGENIFEIRPNSLNEQPFQYRWSFLKDHPDWIVIGVKFRIEKDNCREVGKRNKHFSDMRIKRQPEGKSAGCVFKNPKPNLYGKRVSVGLMVEQADLMGFKIGNVQISRKHGNFFINLGRATATDYLNLIEFVKDRIRRQYCIELEEEIIRVGEF